MKKRTVISFLCAVTVTAGAVAGLTGFKGRGVELEKAELTANEKYQLISTSEIEEARVSPAGTITGVSDKGIEIAAGGKTLVATVIQMPGKKRVEVKEFLKGNNIEIGTVLG